MIRRRTNRISEKIDREATAERGFKDKHSYVHLNGHIYLRGKDVGILREKILRPVCEKCLGSAPEGEMDHIKGGRGLQRCWCPHNLQWLCHGCHEKKHNRFPQWTRKASAA